MDSHISGPVKGVSQGAIVSRRAFLMDLRAEPTWGGVGEKVVLEIQGASLENPVCLTIGSFRVDGTPNTDDYGVYFYPQDDSLPTIDAGYDKAQLGTLKSYVFTYDQRITIYGIPDAAGVTAVVFYFDLAGPGHGQTLRDGTD
jgi:hypothetical protein